MRDTRIMNEAAGGCTRGMRAGTRKVLSSCGLHCGIDSWNKIWSNLRATHRLQV